MVNFTPASRAGFSVLPGPLVADDGLLDAFALWRDVGLEYERAPARVARATAIHMGHRIGAVVWCFSMSAGCRFTCLRVGNVAELCRYGMLVLLVFLAQTGARIMNCRVASAARGRGQRTVRSAR